MPSLGEQVIQESISKVVATGEVMVTTLMLGLKVKWPASVAQSPEHSITDHEIEDLNLGTRKNCQRKNSIKDCFLSKLAKVAMSSREL